MTIQAPQEASTHAILSGEADMGILHFLESRVGPSVAADEGSRDAGYASATTFTLPTKT